MYCCNKVIYLDYKADHPTRKHNNNSSVKFVSLEEDSLQKELCFATVITTSSGASIAADNSTYSCEELLLFEEWLKVSGGSKAAITARTRIEWLKFRECGELFYGRKFSLKTKGRIYQSCIRSAMPYGSETWV